jgi:protein-S-isoprenylcysteine O-methyltransferase Ste14
MLLVRALIGFLVLPAVVAGLAPWLLLSADRWRSSGSIVGWPVLAFGLCVLMWCVRDFYVIGRGTLAPWSPPRRLVIVGLYRIVRNPMYVGVLGIVTGWSLLTGSPILLAYGALLAIAFHLRVLMQEEPALARSFGDDWVRYRDSVNRWLPRFASGPRV